MNHWICTNCGYILCDNAPPERCPGCHQPCQFNNVTCYRPECGFEQNIDPLLVATALRAGGKPHGAVPEVPLTAGLKITRVDILSGLSAVQKQQVMLLARNESYDRGALITVQGNMSDKLYLVEDGEVAIVRNLAFQKQIPITIIPPGETFGWSSLVPPFILTSSGMATKKTTLMIIEASSLQQLFKKEPALGLVMMRNVAEIIANRLKTVEMEIAAYIYA